MLNERVAGFFGVNLMTNERHEFLETFLSSACDNEPISSFCILVITKSGRYFVDKNGNAFELNGILDFAKRQHFLEMASHFEKTKRTTLSEQVEVREATDEEFEETMEKVRNNPAAMATRKYLKDK